MWELLDDVNWDFIAVVVAVAGVVCTTLLGVAVFLLQRRRKELGYRVISRTPLVSVEADVKEQVVVVFGGEIVTDVHLVMVEVVNWGNQAIVPDDYQRPLCVDLGTGARVLSVGRVDSKPEGLDVSASIVESRDKVAVDPLLLNAGDSFTLKILVSTFSGAVSVGGRVVGVKEIGTVLEGTNRWGLLLYAVIVLPLGSVVVYMAVRAVEALRDGSWAGAVLFGAGSLLVLEAWGRLGLPVVTPYLRGLRAVTTRE